MTSVNMETVVNGADKPLVDNASLSQPSETSQTAAEYVTATSARFLLWTLEFAITDL